MHKKLTLLLATGALGTAVAGCGTSKAPGIVLAPSGGATTSTTAAAVTTPKTGALSKEPTIAKPTGAAPKQLVVKNLITGTGATAAAGDTIVVNYVGALYSNGKVFDSSWKDGSTFTATLASSASASGGTSVIPGWVKGLVGMKVGGRRQLIIPPSLAYGSQASGSIPANSTLIFDIDLLKVEKPAS
jgi:FKBP-type peptidyl-prolyl cis-trans isomerase